MNKHYWLIAACAALSLSAEETAIVNRARVNVRGGPSFTSEVIAQLQKGDTVTFLEEIPIEKPKAGEPAKWAAIRLPEKTAVWVFNDFLNDHTVKAPRLNLRAGPGENFSVVGRLQRGDTVKEIRTVEGWMQIEAPETARAYIDATYLTRTNTPPPEPIKVFEPKNEPVPVKVAETPPPVVKEQPPVVVAAKPPEPKPTPPAPVEPKVAETKAPAPRPAEVKPAESKLVEVKPAESKLVETKPAEVKPPIVVDAKPPEEKPVEPKPIETKANPAPVEKTVEPTPRVLPQVAQPIPSRTETVVTKRVVRREGKVGGTALNIQAPTYFQLVSPDNGKIINYLRSEKMLIKLKDYKGLRVIVTGEELMDSRYPERPMLEVETIEVAP